MQELLPEAQATFDRLKTAISETYRRHGFLKIETPTIDRTEILFAKAGGDTEKQVYRVFKTAETADDSDQALRFDHTVPLARYVVEHENDLAFPFKVTQIGRNFRGERAQKGRFREFYQADVDVISRSELPLEYDAEVILTLMDTFSNFELNTPIVARISNRKILNGLIRGLGLETKSRDIFSIIDHSEKVPEEKTLSAFSEIGLPEDETNKIVSFMNIRGKKDEVISQLNSLDISDELFKEGIYELGKILTLIEANVGASEIAVKTEVKAVGDMKIVRGLDYYTGTVFEFNLPEYPGLGSISGGGRYDNLAGYFTEQKLPGVGGSIGLTRLFYVLTENNLLKSQVIERLVDYVIVPISENEIEFSMKVATDLRKDGSSATIIFSNKRLGDKLNYAAKISQKAIIIGENEAKSGQYEIKELFA